MAPWVWINGQLIEQERAVVPLTDRGFLFGDGLFTTVRIEEGEPELWHLHLQRLANASLPPPGLDDVESLLKENNAQHGTWRLKVILTEKTAAMLLQSYTPPVGPLKIGYSVSPYSAPSAQMKSLAYLDRLLYLREAQQRELDNLLICGVDGYILEAATANIFWEWEEKFYTPSRQLPLIWGTRLQSIWGENWEEVTWRAEDVPPDATGYLCNALMRVVRFRLEQCC